MDEISKFPVLKIPFTVSKNYFRTLGSYEHHVPEEFFYPRFRNREIIPFPI